MEPAVTRADDEDRPELATGRLDELRDALPPQRWHTLVQIFLSSGRESLESAASAQSAGDFAELERLAHHMKGSYAAFGAERQTARCARLERCSARGDAAGAADLLEDIEKAWRSIEATVRSHLAAAESRASGQPRRAGG